VNAAQPWAYPSLAQPHSPQVKSTSPGTGAIFGESLSPRKRPDGHGHVAGGTERPRASPTPSP
jgi:hypothetical protein